MGYAGMFTILDVILDEHLFFLPLFPSLLSKVGLIILSAVGGTLEPRPHAPDGLEKTALAGREDNSTLLLPEGGCFGVTSDGEMILLPGGR